MNYLPFIFPLVLLGLIIWFFVYKFRATIKIPLVLPQSGFSVPVINSYIGSVWFNIHNGLYSSLKFFDDHFEYVILLKKIVPYSNIREVDFYSAFWMGGTTLLIKF